MWDPASAESHTALTYAPVQMRASTSDGRNAVRIPCVDPLAHEGHDRAGEHAARPDEHQEESERIRFAQLPVERRQVKHVQDHGHGDLDETDLLVAKEEVAGTNTAEEKVEKARSLTRLTQHGSVESGLTVAGLAIRLLTIRLLSVCSLLPVAGLAIRLLPVAGLTVGLLAIAGLLTVRLLTVRLLTIGRLLAVTGLLTVRLLAIAGLLTVGRLLTVTGLLTVRLLAIVRLLPVRLLRSRHDVS